MDSNSSPVRTWRHRTGEFILGRRTLIMGIVNVTPDSFSDGGECLEPEAAIQRALQLERESADLVDVGAESTRPGSDPVSPVEQLRRLEPVLEVLRSQLSIPVSVDTSSALVAKRCLDLGVSVINDVSALECDPALARVCASAHAGLVLMHKRGTPKTMQLDTGYTDLVNEIAEYLHARSIVAQAAGIERERIVVDPGIGFGKSFDQNYVLLRRLRHLRDFGAGVLVGTSRKAFTAQFSGKPPGQRQFATAATAVLARMNGADIIRVHDVGVMREVCDIVDRFQEINGGFDN